MYDTGSEVDTGGHTFDADDELMGELVRTINVYTIRERDYYETGSRYSLGALDRASLWDGQDLTISVAEEPSLTWPAMMNILRQDGMNLRFLINLVGLCGGRRRTKTFAPIEIGPGQVTGRSIQRCLPGQLHGRGLAPINRI